MSLGPVRRQLPVGDRPGVQAEALGHLDHLAKRLAGEPQQLVTALTVATATHLVGGTAPAAAAGDTGQVGTASGIGQFYKEVMQAPYTLTQDMNVAVTKVKIGPSQCLIFRETTEEIPDYDGHHIAVYIANFSGPHAWLKKHDLVTEESSAYQYRFVDIVHPETGRKLFAIEHEVRSFTHPMLGREILNRNPSQNIGGYARGRDAFATVA